jgi:two-component system, chemotaxis family, protein-glutamate methylesterase/glutaminase
MPSVLLASPSTFLRIGLMQQLRRQQRKFVPLEAGSADDAARLLAGRAIDLAIIDDTLLAESGGDRLQEALARRARPALLIALREPLIGLREPLVALREPCGTPPPIPGTLSVIAGRLDGVLDMGGIARALDNALEALAVTRPTGKLATQPASAAADARQPARPDLTRPDPRRPAELILMAASTGGPGALAALLGRMEPPRVPIVVAQHMPADQTAAFARHLAVETQLSVSECGPGQLPSAQVAVLRGGADYRLRRAAGQGYWLSSTTVAGNAFHPCADLLFASAAEAGIKVAAVVLSGMGEDGARGAGIIAAHGGGVLVQDFDSCVVPGMPAATRAACPSAVVASLPKIAERLARWTAPSSRGAAALAEET